MSSSSLFQNYQNIINQKSRVTSIIGSLQKLFLVCLQGEKVFPDISNQFEELLSALSKLDSYPAELFDENFYSSLFQILQKLNMQCSPLETKIFIFLTKFAFQDKSCARNFYEHNFYEILLSYIDNKPGFLDLSIISAAFGTLSSVSSSVAFDLLENNKISNLFETIPSLAKNWTDNAEIYETLCNILSLPEKLANFSLSYQHALQLMQFLVNVYDSFDDSILQNQITCSLITVLSQCPPIKHICAGSLLKTGLIYSHLYPKDLDLDVFSMSLWLVSVLIENDTRKTKQYITLEFMNSIAPHMSMISTTTILQRKWYYLYQMMTNSDSLIDIFMSSDLHPIALSMLDCGIYNEIENILIIYSLIFAKNENLQTSFNILNESHFILSLKHIMQWRHHDKKNIDAIIVNLMFFLQKIAEKEEEIPLLFHQSWLFALLQKFSQEKDPELEQSSKELLDLYKEFNIESFDADVEENSEEDIE